MDGKFAEQRRDTMSGDQRTFPLQGKIAECVRSQNHKKREKTALPYGFRMKRARVLRLDQPDSGRNQEPGDACGTHKRLASAESQKRKTVKLKKDFKEISSRKDDKDGGRNLQTKEFCREE